MPTALPPPKRARTDDTMDEQEPEPTDRPVTPAASGLALVSEAARSLPTSVQDYLFETAKRFNRLQNRKRQQLQNKARFEQDDFVPRSARIGFELKATESVTETEDFKTLSIETKTAVETLQATIKKNIASVISLEIQAIEDELTSVFFNALNNLIGAMYLDHIQKDVATTTIPINNIARYIFDQQTGHLYNHMQLTNENVLEKYKKHVDDDINHVRGTTPEAQVPLYSAIRQKLLQPLLATFVSSWQTQANEYRRREAESAILRHLQTSQTQTAVEATARQIDAEPTADPTTISQIIEKKVNEQNKKLLDEIQKLKQKLPKSDNAKNSSRGANSDSASSKNKKKKKKKETNKNSAKKPKSILKTPSSPSKRSSSPESARTVAFANDSSDENKTSKKSKKKKKKNGKGTNNKSKTK